MEPTRTNTTPGIFQFSEWAVARRRAQWRDALLNCAACLRVHMVVHAKKGPRSLQAADKHRSRKLEVLAHFYTGVKPDWKVSFVQERRKKKTHKSEQLQWKTSEYFDRGFLAWLQPTGVGGVSTSHQAGANQTARAAAFIVPDSHFGQTGIRGNVS